MVNMIHMDHVNSIWVDNKHTNFISIYGIAWLIIVNFQLFDE
jgi:hypothetical protein